MTKPTTIGIDLAKHIFQVATLNHHHKLTFNTSFSRRKLTEFMVQQPRCIVGMEACGSSHYWSGVFTAMGHTVKLLPPAYVKGFVYGNKNDTNDAKAIALAAAQPESPTVCTKVMEWTAPVTASQCAILVVDINQYIEEPSNDYSNVRNRFSQERLSTSWC